MSFSYGDGDLATPYTSSSQRARVVTEAWVAANGYCLACESDRLNPTRRNTQSRDFECSICSHPYELKSAASPFGRRVVDGAYGAMMRRVQTGTVPSFLLLQYSPNWSIVNFKAIHHVLITPEAIEQRNALSPTARRAGWIGCNILLTGIPLEGKISLIIDGVPVPKEESRKRFAEAEALSILSPENRSWTSSFLILLRTIRRTTFTIQDAYSLEPQLKALFPSNRHIRAKIRQQLQVLRDAGLLSFESRGSYKFTKSNPQEVTHD